MGRNTSTAWTSWKEYRQDEQLTVSMPKGGDLRAAFFFPDDYSVGMSNLGFHYIYRKLRDNGVEVERFFHSPMPYRSVENDTLLERFPLILASVSYEGDVLRLVKWLKDGGIDPRRRERQDADSQIIGVGGAITYINPLIVSGVADLVALGDGEDTIAFAVEALRRPCSREEKLRRIAEHSSFLVPSVHIDGASDGGLVVHKDEDIDAAYGRSTWITPRAVFGRSLLVELQRGCAGRCKFCTLPASFGPVRQRDASEIARDIREAASAADFDQVGLITPEAGYYRDIRHVLASAKEHSIGVSFASLRVDHLTHEMLEALVQSSRRSITVAPESGADALRRSCGKHFTNDTIRDKLSMARNIGLHAAKLYFMIGLPGETDCDIKEISALCERLRSDTGLSITAAVSPFVPKVGTEWCDVPFAGPQELKRKMSLLKRSFPASKGIVLRTGSVREACAEYALNWGGAAASDAVATCSYSLDSDAVDRSAVMEELHKLGLYIRSS